MTGQTLERDPIPYFAYGTLLGPSHMRSRYPSAERMGIARYPGHQLWFWAYGDEGEGGCTIIDEPRRSLIGVLYTLSREDMTKLMAVDGAAHAYEVREIDVIDDDGRVTHAVTLRVESDAGDWVPPEPYAQLVTDGALELGLPDDYRAELESIVAAARAPAAR
jgi:hypothetical protein